MDQDLDINELELITGKLFDALRKQLKGQERVRLDFDYYWDVSPSDAFDMTKRPVELHCGQLQDDLAFLLRLLDDDRQAFPLMFVHLAPIIKYLAVWNESL